MSEQTASPQLETLSQRFDVFLSHNSRDKPAVERIAAKLKREGIEPWLDKWCLTPAGDWQEELARGLSASATCAVFVGPAGFGSWEDLELKLATDRMAKERAFRVFLVLLPGLPEPFDTSGLPPFLSLRTWVDLRQGIEDARSFQSLIHAVKGLPLGPETPIEQRNDVCPYRGLQAFDEEHAEFFFGRDGDIQRLVEKLKATRFLAVVGPSGSGKSSLVRAGVIPALKKGVLPESDTWTFRVFKPGARPLTSLAANLLRLYPEKAMGRTLDEMSEDERALHLAVSLGLTEQPAGARVVWVIDQFEEIFTLCNDERERAQFLANLLYAAFVPDGRCVVLLTLRADFYHKCAAYPELSSRIAAQQFLVSLMSAENLRQAIEEPAWHTGLEFEQGLVETILEDVENQPGALPLLEHALLELWERRRGMMLTLEAYRESGGVEGAIAKRADAIYTSFDATQQLIARRIMLRLTQPGEGTEDTRRRAAMAELVTRADEADEVESVVRALADARLLMTSGDDRETEAQEANDQKVKDEAPGTPAVKVEAAGTQTVDVSHEALVRGWPRLRKWIEEDRAGLRILRRLTEAAREWQPTKDESLLYRGARLAQAVEWRERNEDALNESERAFLDASVAAQRAVERRRRRIIIGLAAGLIIAIALAALSFIQWRRADEQAQIARSRQLAAESLALMENQPALGLLLSVEANRVYESLEARSILLIDMQYREYLEVFLHGHTAEVHKVVFSPDGKLMASASGTDGKDNSVRLWDAASGQPVGQPLTGLNGNVLCVVFSHDGKTVAFGDDLGGIILWDVAGGRPLGQPLIVNGDVFSLAFSPDDKLLASGSSGGRDIARHTPQNGEIHLWDVATQALIGEPLKGPTATVSSLAFSPDGKILASGSGSGVNYQANDDYPIIFWDVAKGQPLGSSLQGHTKDVSSIAFSPDGKLLASGSEDKTVKLWDVSARKPLDGAAIFDRDVSEPHTDAVLDVQFTEDGKTLISADAGNHILIRELDVQTNQGKSVALANSIVKKSLIGYFSRMRSIAYSPKTAKWAIGGCRTMANGVCVAGEVSIWNAAARLPISQPIAANTDAVQCVAFSPRDKILASGGCSEDQIYRLNGEVHLWDTTTRQPIGPPLKGAPKAVTSLAYSPDGKILAAGSCANGEQPCKQGEIRLWDTDTRQLISQPLAGHTDSVRMLEFSPDGKILASSEGDSIILWDAATRQSLGEIKPGYKCRIRSMAFNADSKTLATSSCNKDGSGGEIGLWSVATRQMLGEPLLGHLDTITTVDFSPDGKILASASGNLDGSVKFWDVATRQLAGRELTGHVTGVEKIVFSPDGEMLASTSNVSADKPYNIFLWDLATRQLIGLPLNGNDERIQDLAFSPDSRMLASGDSDKNLLLWNVSLDLWMKDACRVANRNLTQAEWGRYFPDQPYHKTCPNLPEPSS